MQRSFVAATAIASFTLVSNQASAQLPSTIYFFGDSFTDVGSAAGLAALNGLSNPTPSPPYASGGRFSNGPIWSELFATRLGRANDATSAWPGVGAGNNYAVGGATTGTLGSLGSPTGILSQGALFAAQHPTAASVPAGALFVIWGGGNDIINAVSMTTAAARQTAITQAANNITTFASYLATTFGARNFLIPLTPNVGAAPMYAGNADSSAIATSLTNTFDGLLLAGIQGLNAFPGINARALSLNNLLTNIQIDAAAGGARYGLTNTRVPCFALPNPPVACNTSVFVDNLHSTAKVQSLIADAAYDQVINSRDVAVVPEPSEALMMAAGLGTLAAVAARKKKGSV